jgi:SAM-dependent methyltransferase
LHFANHVSIKFFNKKIKQLAEIKTLFAGKNGLEIGGPSKIFTKEGYIPVYPLIDNVDGVNFSGVTIWENTIEEGLTYNVGNQKLGTQYIKDGTDLSIIPSDKYDFILSSHSLEHIANPLKALKGWLRVLKPGGALLLILPDSRYTFDCNRPVTKFEHLKEDELAGTPETDLTHLDEILALHALSYDDGVENIAEFEKRSKNNFENRCLHHHVFDLELMETMLTHVGLKIVLKDVAPPFNLIMMAIKQA